MKCEKCGAELLDNARVCDVCGEPVVHKKTNLMDYYEEVPADEDDGVGVYFVPPDGSSAPEGGFGAARRRGGKRRSPLLIAAIVVILIAAAYYGYVAYVYVMQNGFGATETTEESAEKPRLVQVTLPIEVRGEGLGDEGSRIPLEVRKATNEEQTSEDGQTSGEEQAADGEQSSNQTMVEFVKGDGKGLGLEAGDYVVRIACTPISGQGALYFYPEPEFRVHIPGKDGKEFEVEEVETVAFDERPNGEVSEELINEAASWIKKDTDNAASADTLVQRARDRYLGVA